MQKTIRLFALSCICLFLCVGSQHHLVAGELPVVYIKKNTPFSEQAIYPNTKYIIGSSIDLNGETVIIPEGCTLCFEKGSLSNGAVIFQKTVLEGEVVVQCGFEGTLGNTTIFTDWFVKGRRRKRNIKDSSPIIQSIFNLNPRKVVFGKGGYQFHNITIGNNVEIEGNHTIVYPVVLEQEQYDFNFLKNVFYTKDAGTIQIKGMCFVGALSGTILPKFRSNTIFGEPLIWVDKADSVVVDHCVFREIENCTYCNTAYNYYGKKQGSCVCLWDVSNASIINCEQDNCRHDEQIWVIAVKKPIMTTHVTFSNNYIHDMTPGPNSSAFTCVAGTCLLNDNKVERYYYPGSMFNTFAKKVIIRRNNISDSYCSSVFDACEYSYFNTDDITLEDNRVEAINSALLLAQSHHTIIRNNVFKGLGLYYSFNNRLPIAKSGNYPYWYTDDKEIIQSDVQTVIEGNIADLTYYDGNRSIAGTNADYGTGEILEPQKFNALGRNFGCGILICPKEAKAGSITIKNNVFTSIQSLEGIVDKNNLAEIFPHAIRLINADEVVISDNTFNGGYPTYKSPKNYACISLYNYPDIMESLVNPPDISQKPTYYKKYVIKDNVFNVNAPLFTVLVIYPRKNSTMRKGLHIEELIIDNNQYPQGVKLCFPEQNTKDFFVD